MERFTISLSETLARDFDELIRRKGYQNRSEAVRDILRDHPHEPIQHLVRQQSGHRLRRARQGAAPVRQREPAHGGKPQKHERVARFLAQLPQGASA